MNKGALQNLGVQQMMGATNNNYPPSLWNINNNLIKPPFTSSSPSSSSSTITSNFLSPPPSNNIIISPNYNIISPNYNTINNNMNMSINSSTWLNDDTHFQEHPSQFHESLSQLLLSGILMGEEGRKMEKWEEQIGIEYHHSIVDQMKQESSVNSYNNNNNDNNNKNNNIFITHQINNNIIATSSPQSCVSTTLSDNLHPRQHNPLLVSDHSSECNSIRTSGAQKKPKIQPSSSPSTFKVRKEKLGDRITSLHQLVSPFGKTDTASVLLEAIGYIRFLHGQIEALSLPYLTSGAAGDKNQPHLVEREKKCIFPEDPGQLSNEKSLKRKGSPDAGQDSNEEAKDLRSKGLCLVPLSCTMHVGSDNGADYWAPAIGGGGFR